MSVRCRLVRTDGSEWHVQELREVDDGFRVSGVPNGNGSRPHGSGANGRPTVLEDEPLLRGDRIEWVGGDGEVLWAMKIPVGAAAAKTERTKDPAEERQEEVVRRHR